MNWTKVTLSDLFPWLDWDCVPLRFGKVCAHLCNEQACVCPLMTVMWTAGVDMHTGTCVGVGFQHPEERTSPLGSLGQQSWECLFQGTPRAHTYVGLPPLPRITVIPGEGVSTGWHQLGCTRQIMFPGSVAKRKGIFFLIHSKLLDELTQLYILPASLQNSLKGTVEGI